MTLAGKKVVVLADDGYEDLELWVPYYRLLEAGAEVVLAAHEKRPYASKHTYPCEVDTTVASLNPDEFDAVVIPGGVQGPDRMRRHREILDFVKRMDESGKVVAAICHAAWVPISAKIVKGRRMTSFSSVRDDCINAGAEWIDQECVVDENLITSRHPDDLPAFCRAIVGALGGSGEKLPSEERERLKRKQTLGGRAGS
jgi:protease I